MGIDGCLRLNLAAYGDIERSGVKENTNHIRNMMGMWMTKKPRYTTSRLRGHMEDILAHVGFYVYSKSTEIVPRCRS